MIYQPIENTGEYTTGTVYSEEYVKRLEQEIEKLNNIINQIESIVYADISNIDARITIQEVLDKELKGSDK